MCTFLSVQWVTENLGVHCVSLEPVLSGGVNYSEILFVQIPQQQKDGIQGVRLEVNAVHQSVKVEKHNYCSTELEDSTFLREGLCSLVDGDDRDENFSLESGFMPSSSRILLCQSKHNTTVLLLLLLYFTANVR